MTAPEDRGSPRRRRRGRRWAYPLFLLLTTAVGLEVAARALLEAPGPEQVLDRALPRLLNSAWEGAEPTVPRLSPSSRSTVRSGDLRYTVVTNSLGFRGREPAARAPEERRLLFLGDSMVFGDWLEEDETIPARVEALAADQGARVSAYNAGLLGLNTVHELLVARELLPVLAPDRVVLGYFLGNDPLANVVTVRDSACGSYVDPQRADSLEDRLAQRLRPWLASHAVRYAALRLIVPRLRYAWSTEAPVLDRTIVLVEEMRQLCAEAGAAFTVVLIYPKDGREGSLYRTLSGSRRLGHLLATRLRSRGIDTIDPDEAHPQGPAGPRFQSDGHLSPLGADAIARLVVAHPGVLPDRR